MYRALTLLSRSDNVSRHFIDAFGHLVKFLKPLLLQIKPSYHYAEDIDMLRANSILNPMYEGLDMGKPIENYLITTIDGITTTTSATAHATNPANMQTTATVTHASVNTLSKISVHIEIMNLQKYMDYVVLVSLACPPLLYDEKCFELFKEVSTGTLFVEIFRDVVRTSYAVTFSATIRVCVYILPYVVLHSHTPVYAHKSLSLTLVFIHSLAHSLLYTF